MEGNASKDGHTQTAGSGESGFFGAMGRKQSYLNIVYLLLSFPLGIFYFVFIVTSLALGFGLLIVWVGLFILIFTLVAIRGLAAAERQLAAWLLGVTIPPPDPISQPWQHPFTALKKYGSDPYTWKSLAYLISKFPLSIITFIIVVFLISLTGSLLFAPLMYQFVPVHILHWRVDSAQEALLCMAVGLVLAVLSIHCMNGLAAAWRAHSILLLAAARPRTSRLRSGPVVIP